MRQGRQVRSQVPLMSRISRLLLAALVLTAVWPGPADAQKRFEKADKPAKEYRPLPFDGDLAAVLKEQLLETQGMEGLKELLNEILKDPQKFEKYKGLANQFKAGGPNALDPET